MLSLRQGLGLNTIKTVGGGYENLYSLDFDGVDDYVSFSDNAALRPTAAMSVNIWFKLDDFEATATMRFVGNFYGIGGNTGYFIRWSNKTLTCFIVVNSTIYQVSTGFDKFKSGQHYYRANGWHMVTLTFDGEFINLYIDGALENSGGTPTVDLGSTGNTITQATQGMTFARHTSSSSQFLSGLLDECSIFDTALPPAEISEYWNNGTPTDLSGESNLLGYWRNGDTAGASVFPTIEDFSSNSNNGTMTNMVSGDIVTDVP